MKLGERSLERENHSQEIQGNGLLEGMFVSSVNGFPAGIKMHFIYFLVFWSYEYFMVETAEFISVF